MKQNSENRYVLYLVLSDSDHESNLRQLNKYPLIVYQIISVSAYFLGLMCHDTILSGSYLAVSYKRKLPYQGQWRLSLLLWLKENSEFKTALLYLKTDQMTDPAHSEGVAWKQT